MKKFAKIVNEETKLCSVGIGTDTEFYRSLGMSELDVEQGRDGQWYLKGFAPLETLEQKNEKIRQNRQTRFELEADPLQYDYAEALARGEASAEEKKQIWLTQKDKIREELPYLTD